MNISIDGKVLDEAGVEGDNLEEILFDLQDRHVPKDRMVGDVMLNGKSYSEDVPHAAVEVSRSNIRTLELITRSSEEVALHFLGNAPNLIESLVESLPVITEMFRLGDESEANEHFLRFLESLHLLVSMLERVGHIMQLRFDQSSDGRESLDQRLQKLAEILTELLNIQEQSDWVYLADILEYELTPELEALRDLVPRLQSASH